MDKLLCRMNIDVAFYLSDPELQNSEEFLDVCKLIREALEKVVADVEIDTESFDVLD